MNVRFFLWLPFVSFCLKMHSQKPIVLRAVPEMEVNEHIGKLIKIHGEYPNSKTTSLTEIFISKKTRGDRSWHVYHGYPSFGISLIAANLGNKDTLGYALSTIPTVRFEFPIKNSFFFIRAGLGLGWFSKPYDALENPGNLVIGSKIANMSQLYCGYAFPLRDRIHLNVGLSATHGSNAHFKVPNIGANIISIVIGASFIQHPSIRNLRTIGDSDDRKEKNKNQAWRPSFSLNYGIHEFQGTVRPIGGASYSVFGLTVAMSRLYRMNGRVSAGINLYYYSDYYDYIIGQQLFPPGTNAIKKSFNLSIYIGREWIFGKFGLFIQAGANVYAPFAHKIANVWDLPSKGFLGEWTSNKFGYHYYPLGFTKKGFKPFTGIAVKANGGTADFLEFSIGSVF